MICENLGKGEYAKMKFTITKTNKQRREKEYSVALEEHSRHVKSYQ